MANASDHATTPNLRVFLCWLIAGVALNPTMNTINNKNTPTDLNPVFNMAFSTSFFPGCGFQITYL